MQDDAVTEIDREPTSPAAPPEPATSPASVVASPAAPTKVEARGINVYYGDKQAIFDCSISISDASVTAFIGPSGCGKSTFLRCINRMNDTIESAKVEGE
ncbi:MAG: ATP-binding cassette domain-containing protein, partial [Maricaulaceae bacterium]